MWAGSAAIRPGTFLSVRVTCLGGRPRRTRHAACGHRLLARCSPRPRRPVLLTVPDRCVALGVGSIRQTSVVVVSSPPSIPRLSRGAGAAWTGNEGGHSVPTMETGR